MYSKLVRDRIPEIIEATGKHCATEILSEKDFLKILENKLDEEVTEYHYDQSVEELADIVEVVYAIAKAHGFSLEQLEAVRAKKAGERGCFEKRILLKDVTD